MNRQRVTQAASNVSIYTLELRSYTVASHDHLTRIKTIRQFGLCAVVYFHTTTRYQKYDNFY